MGDLLHIVERGRQPLEIEAFLAREVGATRMTTPSAPPVAGGSLGADLAPPVRPESGSSAAAFERTFERRSGVHWREPQQPERLPRPSPEREVVVLFRDQAVDAEREVERTWFVTFGPWRRACGGYPACGPCLRIRLGLGQLHRQVRGPRGQHPPHVARLLAVQLGKHRVGERRPVRSAAIASPS